jgi:hypothetical protein
MQLKPDELPDMVEDEIRRVTLNLAGVVGVNTIDDCEVTCDTLTIGTPSISGTSISFNVTATNPGTHYILASADLSSQETVKGYIRAKVAGQPCTQTRDYE